MAKLIKIGKMHYSDLRMNGKRIRRALSIYEPKAMAMLADLVELRRSQKHGYAPKDISWDFFKERIRQYIFTDLARSTAYRYEQAFTLVDRVVTLSKLRQMTPEMMETLKFRWKEINVRPFVITKSIICLKAAMKKAQEWKYIHVQEWASVKVVIPKGRLRYYTAEDYRKIQEQAKGPLLTAVHLMGEAGLRSGEVFYLEWPDIEFDYHRIWIHYKKGWKPKWGIERRVDLTDELEAYLKSIAKPQGYVIERKWQTLGGFQHGLADVIEAAGLKGPPHTLRHTFAAHFISQPGASLPALQKLMGHKSQSTTQIYAHLMPHATQAAIKLFPKGLSTFVPVPNSVQPVSVSDNHQRLDGKQVKVEQSGQSPDRKAHLHPSIDNLPSRKILAG